MLIEASRHSSLLDFRRRRRAMLRLHYFTPVVAAFGRFHASQTSCDLISSFRRVSSSCRQSTMHFHRPPSIIAAPSPSKPLRTLSDGHRPASQTSAAQSIAHSASNIFSDQFRYRVAGCSFITFALIISRREYFSTSTGLRRRRAFDGCREYGIYLHSSRSR